MGGEKAVVVARARAAVVRWIAVMVYYGFLPLYGGIELCDGVCGRFLTVTRI